MKILLDTNLLIPAWLYPSGVCAKVLNKAIEDDNIAIVVCTHSIKEFLSACDKKFPNYMDKIQRFLSDSLLPNATLIRTPLEKDKVPDEELIRDVNDRPILRAAIAANVDIIVTGDKDFLEASLKYPKVMSPVEFINL